jgi:hypothetical protein
LSKQLGLQGEYVVQNPIDAPALEPVVRDHAGSVEVTPESDAERSINARLTPHLRLLQQLQAPIQRFLAEAVLLDRHVPSTSTRPSGLTRA